MAARTGKTTRWTQACVVVAVLLAADAALAVGPGLGLGGDAKFHPYLDFKLGYNSNVNNMPDDMAPKGDMLIQLHPGAYVVVPAEWIALNAGGKLGYTRYLGIESGKTTRNVLTGDADLKATFNPNGAYRFEISDRYQRTENPVDLVFARLAGRHYNKVGAQLYAEPGGKALRLKAGYGFSINMYDDADLRPADVWGHHFNFDIRWRFLPRTALLIHWDMSLIEFTHKGDNYANPNQMPVRAWVGLAGLLTRTLSFNVSAGYGDSLVESGDSYRSGIARVELTQRFPSLGTSISGGYKRDFRPAHVFRYYGEDKVFLAATQKLLNEALSINIRAEYTFLSFGDAVTATDPTAGTSESQDKRADHRVRLSAGLGYDIFDFLGVRFNYSTILNLSDFRYQTTDPNDATQTVMGPSSEFTNHQVWLSFVFHY